MYCKASVTCRVQSMMMTVLTFLMESAEVIIFSLIKTLVKYHMASSLEDLALLALLV